MRDITGNQKGIEEGEKNLAAGFKSEFQPWGYDFTRQNKILEAITNGFLSLQGNPDMALVLLNALKEFYSSIRFLMGKPWQEEYDKRFEGLQKSVSERVKAIHRAEECGCTMDLGDIYSQLDKLRDDLMTERQHVGCGIPASRKLSKRKQLRGAMVGK